MWARLLCRHVISMCSRRSPLRTVHTPAAASDGSKQTCLRFRKLCFIAHLIISYYVAVVDLGATSVMLMGAALKSNTKQTYSSAQSRYLNFCEKFELVSLPCTEDTLLLYVGFLFEEGLSGSSIRVYLSAVRSLHVFAGLRYPTELLRVKLALRGAVRRTPQPIRKLPITVPILRSLLQNSKHRFDKILIEAVMTLAFCRLFSVRRIVLT